MSDTNALNIAQNSFEWFVTTDQPMTKEESMEYLMNTARTMLEVGKFIGSSETVQELVKGQND